MDFSQRIVSLRKQRKLTQEKLGELVNMSQRSVANWESGERLPSISTLIDLSEKLNVSVDYLLGVTDDPEIKKQPAAESDELLQDVISRIQALPDQVLSRVVDFLDGVQAGQAAAEARPAAPDPTDGPAG